MVLHYYYQKPLALVEAHNFEQQQQQEHFFQQLRTGVFFLHLASTVVRLVLLPNLVYAIVFLELG